MKNRKHIYIWVVMALMLFTVAPAAKADIGDREALVLDLINRFREAPFSRGIDLGYGAETLLEKGITPDTVLPPYEFDETLEVFSVQANEQLVDTGQEEPPPVPPLRTRMAETGAVLSFSGAMALDTAGRIFVENLFKTELETGDFAFVLSTDYTHAGLSVIPGVAKTLDNAWFFSLILGSRFRTSDIQVLHLINQVRAEPWTLQSHISEYLLDLVQQNPRIYPIPGMSFHPVFPETSLYFCTLADQDPDLPSQDMTMAEQAAYYGYTGDRVDQTSVAAFGPPEGDETDVVSVLFSALLSQELRAWPYGAIVFSNQFTDAFAAVSFGNPDAMDPGTLTVCAGSGVTEENDPQQGRVYGLVFSDRDRNTLYSPGEELAQLTVSVFDRDMNPVTQVVTDNAGYFSLVLEPHRQWVFRVQAEKQIITQTIHISDNQFVKLTVSPPPQ